MDANKKIRNREIALGMLYVFLAFVFLLFLNRRTVFLVDDYIYSFLFEQWMPNENTRLLSGVSDLPQALKNNYEIFNGRIVSHALVMFFRLFDKEFFDVCNSLMFVLVGLLLLYYIEMDLKKWKSWYLGVLYLAVWVCFPAVGASVLWISGSCNYLWMVALTLGFLLPFYRYTATFQMGKYQALKAIAMIPLGLLAGNSKENGGGAVILLAILLLGYWIWKKQRIPIWSVTGIISAVGGLVIILLSPSNKERIDISFVVYLKRIRELVGFSYHYILPLLIILIYLAVILIRLKQKLGKDWFSCLVVPFFLCLGGAASVVVLVVSPSISGRSWIWAVCFMIIAIGKLCRELAAESYRPVKQIKIVVGMLIVIAGVQSYFAVKDINRTYNEFQQQLQIIIEQKELGNMDVVVPILTASENEYNAIYHLPQLTLSKDELFNRWMALYYGVDSITGIERQE